VTLSIPDEVYSSLFVHTKLNIYAFIRITFVRKYIMHTIKIEWLFQNAPQKRTVSKPTRSSRTYQVIPFVINTLHICAVHRDLPNSPYDQHPSPFSAAHQRDTSSSIVDNNLNLVCKRVLKYIVLKCDLYS
jgi:hypothetical protein